MTTAQPDLPRVGMLATVRNRRGIIASVDAFDGRADGRLHLVRVEYTDPDGAPEDLLLWERERNRRLLEPTAMPRVADEPPMNPAEFDALVRATRWSAITPFVNPDGSDGATELPIASPFFGAVQVEDFQLVPLLQALQMPRISLLLADDVGLGKTIEAGLILTELLIRRRIRRVLILSPASLRKQWQQEMRDKFALSFDQVDRDETHALQSRLGLDANPWRTVPRIIASYYYLRQPDVFEQFRAACKQPEGSHQLPWDLLIVDEAHNLMPSSFGEDSDLCKLLRMISPWFEHKLFLTATPHNGHTRSFTGLLELLDPVRFTQKSELSEAERARVEGVLVRRLKSEINALDDKLDKPRRFADRFLEPVPLFFGNKERALSDAFVAFRTALKALVKAQKKSERRAGSFAVEILCKRLLSCPQTFAESWFRFKHGLAEDDAATADEVRAAQRASEEDVDDDRERDGRARHAAKTVGAWLKPFVQKLEPQVRSLDSALEALGLREIGSGDSVEISTPSEDQRFDRIVALIKKQLRSGKAWRRDERLIVFTEYKTTLDYVVERLREAFADDGTAIRVLFGGMPMDERDAIKRAFNDPDDPVRVLVATDAAAEGLNLQETARFVLHFDVPWNPSRLEQRNGRLDRHGQARDVTVFHFTSEDDADLEFLAKVVTKVHDIREDLGSMGEVFDAAFEKRFEDQVDAKTVAKGLDADVDRRRGRAAVPRKKPDPANAKDAERLDKLCEDLDLAPATLSSTLEVALGVGVGLPRLDGPDERGRMRLKHPFPKKWEPLIDESLRLPSKSGDLGAVPLLVFDPKAFIELHGGRPVFRPAKDAVLMHLGHPMFRESLATFARLRFPGDKDFTAPSRWTIRRGKLDKGLEAVVLVTVEELAINELREPFHHWVRTLRLPIRGGQLGKAEEYTPPAKDRVSSNGADAPDSLREQASELWLDVQAALRGCLKSHSTQLTKQVHARLAETAKSAQREADALYKNRLKEVEAAMKETTLARLVKERDEIKADLQQLKLLPELLREQEEALQNIEDELQRRTSHYRDLLELLKADQDRVIRRMLPKRFELRGDVQVFPVAVELRLPEVRR